MDAKVTQLLPNKALCVDATTLAARVRAIADRIESGELSNVERVIVILDRPFQPTDTRTYGRPTTAMELVGLLEYAKHSVMNPAEED